MYFLNFIHLYFYVKFVLIRWDGDIDYLISILKVLVFTTNKFVLIFINKMTSLSVIIIILLKLILWIFLLIRVVNIVNWISILKVSVFTTNYFVLVFIKRMILLSVIIVILLKLVLWIFWSYAFKMTIHLISCMPIVILNCHTPFEILFKFFFLVIVFFVLRGVCVFYCFIFIIDIS